MSIVFVSLSIVQCFMYSGRKKTFNLKNVNSELTAEGKLYITYSSNI